ncbi:hypothetical protein IQ255_06135 [Pleurocapsales cyanobacterium LEGE 10410]|nr:hypothetical protein [Pleurocapsales cyanobacterium LEGE 10410]
MKRISQALKELSINRIIISLLLGIILLATTACSNPRVSKAKEADLTTGKQETGLIYSKSQKVKSLDSVDDFVSPKQQQELLDPNRIPSPKQPNINRANPENKLLEKTKQMFEDAGNF